MKSLLKHLIISTLIISAWSSCDVINPEESIPAYLYLEEITLENNPAIEEGTLRHKIVAANVIVNGEAIGIIPLPSRVPVLQTGESTITIDPVVQANGNSEAFSIYPFYERISLQRNLQEAVVDTLELATRYKADTEFVLLEDFSGSGTVFTEDLDDNLQTFIETTSDGAQANEGKAGLIEIDTDNILFAAATAQDTPLDISDALQIWLEVSYKTEAVIEFGIINTETGVGAQPLYEYGVNEKNEWNKVYFDLINIVNFDNINSMQLAMRTGLSIQDGEFTRNEADIYIDNIKVLLRR